MALQGDTVVVSTHSRAPRSVDRSRAGLLETTGFKRAPPDGPATRSVCHHSLDRKWSMLESIYS
jgi:hypothetical protein